MLPGKFARKTSNLRFYRRKIDDEAEWVARGLKIGNHNRQMHIVDRFNRFKLQGHLLFDDDVEPMSTDGKAFVANAHRSLSEKD